MSTDPLAKAIREALPICCEECREDPDGALWKDAALAATAARAHYAALLADEGTVEKVAEALHLADWRLDPDGDLAHDLASAALAALAGLIGGDRG